MKSPLVHFLGIGALIYAAYGWTADESYARDTEVLRVTAGEVDWLAESFAKRWNRGPTPLELQTLLDGYIRETVLYREALAMGLDQDDTIIRRRLVQKLEFLFQDLADLDAPTADELRRYFEEHTERFQEPEALTFSHVFVDPDKRGDSTLDDAQALLAELQARKDSTQGLQEVGDRFMLQAYYPERSQMEVAKLFGQEFAATIMDLSELEWHGPVLSGYGVHLIYVHGRTQPPPASFELVQERVLEDLQLEKRQQFDDEYYANLLRRYDLIVDWKPNVELQ